MLSSFILGLVSVLQHIKFEYLFSLLGIYLALVWIFYAIWLWNDISKRFDNIIVRFLVWLVTSTTFIFGLLLYLLVRPDPADENAYWVNLERKYLRYETYGMGECVVCGYDLRPEFLHCPSCGTTLREKCRNCEYVVDLNWKNCPYCGENLKKEPKANPLTHKKDHRKQMFSYDTLAQGAYGLYRHTRSFFVYLFSRVRNVLNVLLTSDIVPETEQEEKKEEVKSVKKTQKATVKDKQEEVKKTTTTIPDSPSVLSKIEWRKYVGSVKKLLFIEEGIHAKK